MEPYVRHDMSDADVDRLRTVIFGRPEMTPAQQDTEVLMGLQWREEWFGQPITLIAIHKECGDLLTTPLIDEILERLIAANKVARLDDGTFQRLVKLNDEGHARIDPSKRVYTPTFAEMNELLDEAIRVREDYPGQPITACALVKQCSPDLTTAEVVKVIAFLRKCCVIRKVSRHVYARNPWDL